MTFQYPKASFGKIFDCSVLLEGQEGVADTDDVFLRQFAVLLAEVLAQWLEPLSGVDELDFPAPTPGFPVAEDPDVGGNAGVVEHVQRQSDDGFQPIVLNDPATDVALALPGVPGEERAAVVDLGDAAAELSCLASSCSACWPKTASDHRWNG